MPAGTDVGKARTDLLGEISSGAGPEFDAAKQYFNDWDTRITNLQHQREFIPYRTKWSAAAHAQKHASDGFRTPEEYLTNGIQNLIRNPNATVSIPSQDGLSIQTEYIQTTSEHRYSFGVVNRNRFNGKETVTTMYEKHV